MYEYVTQRNTQVYLIRNGDDDLTYLLHGAESFLRSQPVNFAASQEFPPFMEPESPSPYPQVPATCPYPKPTPSSPHDPLHLPEDQS